MDDALLIIILLLGGLALVLAEVCTPSFGVLAVAAIVCFAAAVRECFSISPWLGMASVVGIVVMLPLYFMFLVRVFPKTPLGKRLVMRRSVASVGTGVPESEGFEKLLGAEGVATSVLRPSGTVDIDGRRIIASAEGGMIADGSRVKVVRATGMNVVVRAISDGKEG